jgi:hypothetical protein
MKSFKDALDSIHFSSFNCLFCGGGRTVEHGTACSLEGENINIYWCLECNEPFVVNKEYLEWFEIDEDNI